MSLTVLAVCVTAVIVAAIAGAVALFAIAAWAEAKRPRSLAEMLTGNIEGKGAGDDGALRDVR